MPKQSQRLAEQYRNEDEEGRKFLLDGLPYDVGHLKPPAQHQFKPGNTVGKGRPKGSQSVKKMMAEEMESRIPIKDGGRTRKLPASRVMFRQIVRAGVQGNAKSSIMAFDLARRHGVFDEALPDSKAPLFSSDDFEAFRRFDDVLSGSVVVPKESEDQEK